MQINDKDYRPDPQVENYVEIEKYYEDIKNYEKKILEKNRENISQNKKHYLEVNELKKEIQFLNTNN